MLQRVTSCALAPGGNKARGIGVNLACHVVTGTTVYTPDSGVGGGLTLRLDRAGVCHALARRAGRDR